MDGMVFSVVVFLLVAMILTCLVLLVISLLKPRMRPEDLPRCEKVDLLSKKEQGFYKDLRTVAEKNEFALLAKVGLGCILKPKKGVANRQEWGRQLRGEYADFVLCDPDTLKALCVIMLDDNELSLDKTRVGFVDKACDQAEVPLLHVRDYNLAGLEKALLQKASRRAGRGQDKPVDMMAEDYAPQ